MRPAARLAGLFALSLSVASVLAAGGSTATAAWSLQGSGTAAGAAATMPTGSTPVGGAGDTTVTVTWSAASLSNGTTVAGYVVQRYNAATGAPGVVGPGCSGVVSTTTCTESSVPAGTWVYTDTPVQMSWTGGQSAQSAPISVP